MNSKGRKFVIIGIIILIVLIIALFFYFSLSGKNYDSFYEKKVLNNELINPASGLSQEEAILAFNESFVYYLLYNIKAYNLHSPPLSSNTPKIEIFVGEKIYNAEISNGLINVFPGEMSKRDIVIKTTVEEAIKMLDNRQFIQDSFAKGRSSLELIESKSTLFAKGYLNLYNELTGKSVTGNAIKIYTD